MKLVIREKDNLIYFLTYEDEKLKAIDVTSKSMEYFLGNFYVGKVKNIVKNINIAFVEFAKDAVATGQPLFESTVRAARLRLRPILMTSFAFILGVVPLMLATGAGAGGQSTLGTGVVGGMIAATVFSIFFVPVFFSVVLKFFKTKPKLMGAQVSEQESVERDREKKDMIYSEAYPDVLAKQSDSDDSHEEVSGTNKKNEE